MTSPDAGSADRVRSLMTDLESQMPVTTIEELVDASAVALGRPVMVMPTSLPAGQSAAWFSMDERDVILVDPRTDQAQRAGHIAHALAHGLLQHRAIVDDDLLARWAPDLSSEFRARYWRLGTGDLAPVLSHSYAPEHEREALALAAELMQLVAARN